MNRKFLTMGLLAATAVTLCGVGFSNEAKDGHVHFHNAKGKEAGFVKFTQVAEGILVHAELKGLKKGWHGFHLHAVGKCEGPGFTTAGGHFNPLATSHGYHAAAGPHIGDLPNIYVGSNGQAMVEAFVAHATLKAGEKSSLSDADGTAIVVHAKADDYTSQPSGDAGDRVACAVVPKS